jgi:hypothetical protein
MKKQSFLSQHVSKFVLFTSLLKSLNSVYQCINCKAIKNRKKEWQFILLSAKKNMLFFFPLILHPEDLIFQ